MTLTKWLESKFSRASDIYDDFYVSQDQRDFYGIKKMENYNKYYNDNDIDLQNNPNICKYYDLTDTNEFNNSTDCTNYIEYYHQNNDIKIVMIYPAINRAHCNLLFKMLLNYIDYYEMELEYSDIKKKQKGKNYELITEKYNEKIITKNNKTIFYSFCFENSYKNKSLFSKMPTPLKQNNKTNCNKNVVENIFNINPYKNVPVKQLMNIASEIKETEDNYSEWILNIWEDIILPYINGEYRMILGNLNDDVFSYETFYDFMQTLPQYTKMMKLKNHIELAIVLSVDVTRYG